MHIPLFICKKVSYCVCKFIFFTCIIDYSQSEPQKLVFEINGPQSLKGYRCSSGSVIVWQRQDPQRDGRVSSVTDYSSNTFVIICGSVPNYPLNHLCIMSQWKDFNVFPLFPIVLHKFSDFSDNKYDFRNLGLILISWVWMSIQSPSNEPFKNKTWYKLMLCKINCFRYVSGYTAKVANDRFKCDVSKTELIC